MVTNPRTNGFEHAKGLLRSSLIRQYRFVDLLLFLPDADGKDRLAQFQDLESFAASVGTKLICCAAKEEVETWLLAGHIDRLGTPWNLVRSDASVKENHFEAFLSQYGDKSKPGAGRRDLMLATLQNYEGLKARCPEIRALEERLHRMLTNDAG